GRVEKFRGHIRALRPVPCQPAVDFGQSRFGGRGSEGHVLVAVRGNAIAIGIGDAAPVAIRELSDSETLTEVFFHPKQPVLALIIDRRTSDEVERLPMIVPLNEIAEMAIPNIVLGDAPARVAAVAVEQAPKAVPAAPEKPVETKQPAAPEPTAPAPTAPAPTAPEPTAPEPKAVVVEPATPEPNVPRNKPAPTKPAPTKPAPTVAKAIPAAPKPVAPKAVAPSAPEVAEPHDGSFVTIDAGFLGRGAAGCVGFSRDGGSAYVAVEVTLANGIRALDIHEAPVDGGPARIIARHIVGADIAARLVDLLAVNRRLRAVSAQACTAATQRTDNNWFAAAAGQPVLIQSVDGEITAGWPGGRRLALGSVDPRANERVVAVNQHPDLGTLLVTVTGDHGMWAFAVDLDAATRS
ncbi:MAG: hypothetical protein ACI9OJ_005097, partial [Myxococcota bacterium]